MFLGVLVLVSLGKLLEGDAQAAFHLRVVRIFTQRHTTADVSCNLSRVLQKDSAVSIDGVPAKQTAGAVCNLEALVPAW